MRSATGQRRSAPLGLRLPGRFFWACRQNGVKLTRYVLLAHVGRQQLWLFDRALRAQKPNALGCSSPAFDSSWRQTGAASYRLLGRYRASSSRNGTGQTAGSYRTPLGLHRIAAKIGAGYPIGTVFESRNPVGLTWQGRPEAPIAHRILWLAGMEPGFNQGGTVDSQARYIYIHGLGEEPSLGRPASRGCVHLAAADLMPLFDRVPVGTLVWITEG